MNIYTKLYIKEYTRDPEIHAYHKCTMIWCLNLSKANCYACHRDFDLVGFMDDYGGYKEWTRYNGCHRLIGPAITELITDTIYKKSYYINDKYKYKKI